jgi:probable F420-dependent oxidoreductase
MDYGVTIFATDTTIQPIELARAVEERGFESLWLPEHSHIPVSRSTPWGGRAGAPPLPEKYWRCHDTFVALAAAAAVTTNLRLGTGITLLAQRDPIWTAKEVASLDSISGGRVLFGVGYGWNKEEMASHGVRYEDRRRLLRDKLLAMRSLWEDEVASYHGDGFSLEPSWAWPKPVQTPHPPVIFGTNPGPRTIADIVELADGWIPLRRAGLTETLAAVRRSLEEAGRDPKAFDLSYFYAPLDPAFVSELTELGFNRIIFGVESGPPDEVMRALDDMARFKEAVTR